ncbi:Carbon monoxide-induced hydrogenase NuoC-like protein CooU [Rhodovulum sp. PH10]|uniref:NADH-quinone oxidoreductase subunit C n=1 Tax=Rhodovulum sp. PH10 TaxID=1187851 RepID=UPI00027C2AA0|nr:NADH-quinone oxidoreductase subunit C [Rhodovulum sp. PH10]EJW10680.1 Carbon monoxide-induced hydrogenase NuoC-like protein CooU [Rhodovulum sp. PH10]
MTDIPQTRIPAAIERLLREAAPRGIDYSASTDAHGVTVAWAKLADREELLSVAQLLHGLGARLSMISASQPPAPEDEEEDDDEEEAEEGAETAAEKEPAPVPESFGGTPLDGTSYELAYHFDLGGDTLTVIAFLPAGGSVASLTPLFRTADWNERELMECYAITVRNHPDPRRLFLDPATDPAVLERLIPFSTLVNAASTKGLWEKIMSANTGAA